MAAFDGDTAEHPVKPEKFLFTKAGPTPQGLISSLTYEGHPNTLIVDRESRCATILIGAHSFEVVVVAPKRNLWEGEEQP